MSLRQKIENHFRNRSGQGSLVGVIVATVMLSMIVAAGTEWYLSMRKNIGNTEEKLEAQTIAMSEWERLSHMSLDELEASREALKKPYAAGQFTVSVNLGQKGTFNNGTCGAVTGGYANCFKDTTITVSRDGSRLFTTRTLPLMAGDYTRREIDNLLAGIRNDYNNKDNALKNDYTSKYNTLANRLNGKEFVKNRTPNYDLNLRYEKKAGDDAFKLHAYNGNTEIPLASQGGGGSFPDFANGVVVQLPASFIAPCNGIIIMGGMNIWNNNVSIYNGLTYSNHSAQGLWIDNFGFASDNGYPFITIPIGKGQTFYWNANTRVFFVPYK